jgi:hypothetical protein
VPFVHEIEVVLENQLVEPTKAKRNLARVITEVSPSSWPPRKRSFRPLRPWRQ